MIRNIRNRMHGRMTETLRGGVATSAGLRSMGLFPEQVRIVQVSQEIHVVDKLIDSLVLDDAQIADQILFGRLRFARNGAESQGQSDIAAGRCQKDGCSPAR